MNVKHSACLAALVLGGAMALATPASAQRWNHGWGWGAPVAAGVATGAIIGGALATGGYYGPGHYGYGYGPGYYGPGYAYGPAYPAYNGAYAYEAGPPAVSTGPAVVERSDSSASCAARFRSGHVL
jgi:hypothetical protein